MSIRIVIIGAGGLVGIRLSQAILAKQQFHISPSKTLPIRKIVLFDVSASSIPDSLKIDPRVEVIIGDLCDKETIQRALKPEGATRVTTIHLAALLSGNSEDNFDLGMKINLFGTINVMEQVRALAPILGGPQIYVYTSTDYVSAFTPYNKTHPVNEESFRLSPVSYGVQKACNELLVCDYTRKGFIDGRVARLSAVIGRPGFSNSISYPYTGIFTQPLEGKDYSVSLPMDIPYPCSSLNTNTDCFVFLAGQLDGDKLGHNRVIQLPAKSWTLNDIYKATLEVAKEEGIRLGKVTQVEATKGTTTIKEINVCPYVDCSKAQALGLPMSVDLKDIIRDYVHTYIKPKAKL
eukprot:TRINITY_DN15578_c0_g1_i1.p1 TRINITY_DN15578_c0_g1~~TRINITY_DN15578_c0_g1_i1.p1  ORF type:complete len:349 (-),score=64.99 TRINITY_DN15578_c0_g1_i1:95-1141(-)